MFDEFKSYRERLKWKQSLQPMGSVVGDDILSVVLSFIGIKNGMRESLDVFDQLCNNEWFQSIPVLLFMNKSGLYT